MKKMITVLLIFFIGAVVAYNGYNGDKFMYELISWDRAQTLLEQEDITVIDIRTPEEFMQGHIQGAQLINFYDHDFTQQISNLDRSKTYFIYCRSGSRTGAAREVFDSLGFQSVYELENGVLSMR